MHRVMASVLRTTSSWLGSPLPVDPEAGEAVEGMTSWEKKSSSDRNPWPPPKRWEVKGGVAAEVLARPLLKLAGKLVGPPFPPMNGPVEETTGGLLSKYGEGAGGGVALTAVGVAYSFSTLSTML